MTQLPQENDRQRRGRCFCHFRRIDAGSNDRRNLSLELFCIARLTASLVVAMP